MMKIFIACSGLGRVARGYESFAEECYNGLCAQSGLDVWLFKGGGKAQKKQIVLGNIHRNGVCGRALGWLLARDSYYVEQTTFFISLLRFVRRERPAVILFSDTYLGRLLFRWRSRLRAHYKLLFSNGGPVRHLFPGWDHIHQVAPFHLRQAIESGVPASKQSLVPYAFEIPRLFVQISDSERRSLREKLGLPQDREILLSVASINKDHKRIDYLIDEVARISKPRPYLLVAGAKSRDSAELIAYGKFLLGKEGFDARTVPHHEIAQLYLACDAFTLTSLTEGFGRVLVEALSFGLPCFVHDYEVTRYVCGKEAIFGDFSKSGALTELICNVKLWRDPIAASRRHQWVYQSFSWDNLRPQYVSMFKRCNDDLAG